ncbi:MAG TPA: OmpH family outer membrane protein [Candidatus Krumholzibacterium sp.]|nr:OmpH family outer membrane protein [Candidatus Krumholzibacterium sp.]
MKRRISAVVLAAYLFAMLPATALMAQDVKIGYIDTIKIFANFKETVEAEELYKKEVDAWRKRAEEMETQLASMREAIESQSLMASEEVQLERKNEFDKLAREYQQYMKDIFGENGEAARRNQELTQPIVEKINAVIARLAEEQGYTIVFDSSQGNIVYADKAIDLTEAVIAELEQQLETNQ